MQDPTHCDHVHWEFQPGEFHACASGYFSFQKLPSYNEDPYEHNNSNSY